MRGPGYDPGTRSWAVETYRDSRENYSSRAECVAALAEQIGAHVNTVNRWIRAEFGPSRQLSADEAPAKLRAAEAEIERLRRTNRELTERLTAARMRSIQAAAQSAPIS